MKRSFQYQGGKFRHLEWLLPLLPENPDVFVDVFGGSGVVLLNRKPTYHEIFNDLDENLVTFFRVLRENPQDLLHSLSLTPYSRKEFEIAAKGEKEHSDLETARKFLVRIGQAFGGRPQNAGWAATTNRKFDKRPQAWRNLPTTFASLADRFLNVQIECAPALEIIRRYDSPDTLFYCDPPYTGNGSWTDRYLHEMSDEDYRELAEVLQGIKGRAAISGYRSALYDDLYADWQRTDGRPRIAGQGKARVTRQECLWTNYDPAEHARERLLPFA